MSEYEKGREAFKNGSDKPAGSAVASAGYEAAQQAQRDREAEEARRKAEESKKKSWW